MGELWLLVNRLNPKKSADPVLNNIQIVGGLDPPTLCHFAHREQRIELGSPANRFVNWRGMREAIRTIKVHPIKRIVVAKRLRQATSSFRRDLLFASD